MKIGIDISQLAYENTGVANYLSSLVRSLVSLDSRNEYILFFSSMRKKMPELNFPSNCKIKQFKIPPTLLSFIWNKLHILPIERFIGDIDVFVTSDWTEPPAIKAKKATILYDLIVYVRPEETDKKIVHVQRQKLGWVKKESNIVFCISESTKKDAHDILGINKEKLRVIYPGLSSNLKI
jgi:hypothetical protein